MPGQRVTDLQVSNYKELRGKFSHEAAAAKTEVSFVSARRLESSVVLPSQRESPHWQMRADPLSEVWLEEVVPMLESAPSLMAVTLLEELQRRFPEQPRELRRVHSRSGTPSELHQRSLALPVPPAIPAQRTLAASHRSQPFRRGTPKSQASSDQQPF
jgi:hypothetical protein